MSSFVQFVYLCQNLNGSSAPMHWTQVAPLKNEGLGSIGPVEILKRVQFCSVFKYVSKSQRVQCFYALDPLRSWHMSSFVQFF